MRRRALRSCLYLTVALFGVLCGMWRVGSQRPGAPPEMALDPPAIDLNELESGEKKSGEVRIWNKGGSDLIIERIQLSCGCAEADLASNTIKPGSFSICSISLHAVSGSGPKRESAILVSNDPLRPQVRLPISAFIGLSAVVNPTVVDFGRVSISDLPMSLSVAISGKDAREAQQISTRVEVPYCDLEARSDREQEAWRVTVCVLRGNVIIGPVNGAVDVELDLGKNKKKRIRLSVRAEIVGEVSASPPSLLVKPGEEQVVTHLFGEISDARVVSVSNGISPLVATVVKRNGEQFQIELQRSPQNRNEVVATGYVEIECVGANGLHRMAVPVTVLPPVNSSR